MSTETGHPKSERYVLARLATLMATSVDLITKKSRPVPMVDSLLNALQLFKENRLSTVTPLPPIKEEDGECLKGEGFTDFDEFWGDVFKWAKNAVNVFIENPELNAGRPEYLLAAKYIFDMLPAHQCYWNDRFYLAIEFKMDKYTQKEAAWCAVSNGLNGYWEWKTHFGYDIKSILKEIGLDFHPPYSAGMYDKISWELSKALSIKFDLPTTIFGNKESLTEDEYEDRRRLNRVYPYSAVL